MLQQLFSRRHSAAPINWDESYSANTYDGVDDPYQWARYAVLGGIIRRAGATSVLDIGCGFGGLREFLPNVRSYTGLDISSVALDKLPHTVSEQFIAADVENWNPAGVYDAIVLSEVVYYLADVPATLLKLAGVLSPTGLMAVSVYRHPSKRSPNQKALEITREFLSQTWIERSWQFGPYQEFNLTTGDRVRRVMFAKRGW